jgi:hypothetical protein
MKDTARAAVVALWPRRVTDASPASVEQLAQAGADLRRHGDDVFGLAQQPLGGAGERGEQRFAAQRADTSAVEAGKNAGRQVVEAAAEARRQTSALR